MKLALLSAPILAFPDFASPPDKAPFVLYTDASAVGIAGILSQTQDGQERVIAYLSRSLNKAERNYATAQREMLAVVWSVTKLLKFKKIKQSYGVRMLPAFAKYGTTDKVAVFCSALGVTNRKAAHQLA